MEKISFIIPVYNTPSEQLDRCIKSILRIKNIDSEIIIVNDGSSSLDTNNWLEKVKTLEEVKYIYEENSGAAVARNNALDNVTGKYIAFIDADDEMCIDDIENIQLDENVDITFYEYYIFSKDNRQYQSCPFNEKNEITQNILYYPHVNKYLCGAIWGKIFKREFIIKNNIRFSPDLRKAQDRVFMLYCMEAAKKIEVKHIPIYCYYLNSFSITHKYNMSMTIYYYSLYRAILGFKKTEAFPKSYYKYVEYNIFNELLPLTIFNIENQDNYLTKRKKYKELYDKFRLKKALKKLHLSDFFTINGKIKLILYKLDAIWLLQKVYLHMQVEDIKQAS